MFIKKKKHVKNTNVLNAIALKIRIDTDTQAEVERIVVYSVGI